MTQNILITLNLGEFQTLIKSTLKEVLDEKSLLSEPEKEILNVSEASRFLNLGKQTIYNKVSNGELIPIKKSNGKKLYFEKGYLTDWLLEGSPRHQVERYLNKKGGVNNG